MPDDAKRYRIAVKDPKWRWVPSLDDKSVPYEWKILASAECDLRIFSERYSIPAAIVPGHPFVLPSDEPGQRYQIAVKDPLKWRWIADHYGTPIEWIGKENAEATASTFKNSGMAIPGPPFVLPSDEPPSQPPYRDYDCPNCGRSRVLASGICEKCGWDSKNWEPPSKPEPMPEEQVQNILKKAWDNIDEIERQKLIHRPPQPSPPLDIDAIEVLAIEARKLWQNSPPHIKSRLQRELLGLLAGGCAALIERLRKSEAEERKRCAKIVMDRAHMLNTCYDVEAYNELVWAAHDITGEVKPLFPDRTREKHNAELAASRERENGLRELLNSILTTLRVCRNELKRLYRDTPAKQCHVTVDMVDGHDAEINAALQQSQQPNTE